jgi:hypothetical protein
MNGAMLGTILAVVASACAAAPASGEIIYMTLDDPLAGAGGTTPYSIDGVRIVGGYLDSAGSSHGFLYEAGNWSTLDAPDATGGTTAYGVSATRISGTYVAALGQAFGFIYDGTTWTTLSRPPTGGGRVDTFARGIDGTTVVGYSIESAVAHGFVYNAGTFTPLDVPGATGTFPADTDAGRVVGNYDDALGTHGFISDGVVATTLDYPLSTVLGTFVSGVDGPNVVGSYLDLLTGAAHGFLFNGSDIIPIDVPGATDTAVNGIDGMRVVGSYVDGAGDRHGFVATVPEPSCGVVAGLSLWMKLGMRPRRVRRQGRMDGVRSLTRCVPAAVPSLFHNSPPAPAVTA